MEITLHNVKKIEINPVDKEKTYNVRYIQIETSDGENLKIDCFGKSEKDLEVKLLKVENL